MLQKPGKTQVFQGLVDDQPHRPLCRMGADKDHASIKARVGHSGHGDQDLSSKVHVPSMPLARPASSPKHGGKVTLTALRCNVISFPRPGPYLRHMIARLALLASLAALGPGHATTQDDVLQATLLPGWQTASGSHMAAVDLTLAPGWKTYWRSPGDAGIPPRFDWSGSKNVAFGPHPLACPIRLSFQRVAVHRLSRPPASAGRGSAH